MNAHLHWNIFAEELNTVPLHVLPGTIGHVLVETPQQNGPDHDGDVETQASQEAAALQSHVRRPDHQGLSRAVRQREEVVALGMAGAQRALNRAGQTGSLVRRLQVNNNNTVFKLHGWTDFGHKNKHCPYRGARPGVLSNVTLAHRLAALD